MKNILISPLAPEASTPATSPLKWAEILSPLLETLDQHSRRAAREEYIKLLAEQEESKAEARRNEELLNIKQAAELLGVTAQTAWEWQKRQLLVSYRVGKRIFFRRGEVLMALQAQTGPDGRRKYARQSRNAATEVTAANGRKGRRHE